MKVSARNALPGNLRLKVGDRAYAVLNASSVMIGVD